MSELILEYQQMSISEVMSIVCLLISILCAVCLFR